MADDPLTECVHCEEGHVRRVVNSVGIVFKGSGFYVTDNRNGKGKGKAKANGSGAEKTEKTEKTASTAESKSESKPKAAKESTKAAK